MLAKGLVAGCIARATELFLALVDRLMSSESGGGEEALAAASAWAGMLSDVGVGTLLVVLQMSLAEEGLVAASVSTGERSLVVVRTDMFGESGRSIERLLAPTMRAVMSLRLRWELATR